MANIETSRTQRGSKGFALAFAVVVAASSASADVIVQAGAVSVTLADDRCWTVKYICRDQRGVCDTPGTGQGTVISEAGEWAGSIHANEVLHSACIEVDGLCGELENGTTYSGDHIVVQRGTTLGESYGLTSRMEISEAGIRETVLLEQTDSPFDIYRMYGFLGARSNRFTDYAGFDSHGNLLASGTTAQDDQAFAHLDGAVAVAQYDPLLGEGVLSAVCAGAQFGLHHFIWDCASNNKLYCRFHDMEGVLPEGTTFEIQQHLIFFDAPPAQWLSAASALVPEPSSALLLAFAGMCTVFRKRLKPR